MSSLLRIHRSLLALPSAFHPHHTTPASTGNHFAHLRNPPTRNFSLDGTFASISNSAAVAHVQHGLVQLHDITGLPWWATVVLSTVLMRTLITLPLTVYQHRITARLELITGEMPAIVKELKQETVLAKRQFQLTEKQALALYNRSLKKQWDKLVVRENCHPLKTFCVIWGQIPLWIVQSMALRNVLNMQPDPSALQAQLTFVELTVGGCAWFPNLTEVDGSLIMPVALGLLNLAIIEIQVMSRIKERSRLQIYATNFFRVFSVAMIPIAAGVPAALSLYWSASSAYGLGQNLLLLSPAVRRATGIPKTPSELDDPFGHLRRVTLDRLASVRKKFGGNVVG